MSQLTYDLAPAIAFAGMLADSSDNNTRSYLYEGNAAAPFGVMMVQGTNDDQCDLPSAASQVPVGASHHTHAWNKLTAAADAGTEQDDPVNALRKGTIYVLVETAVAPGDAAFFRHTAPGVEQLGAFRNDADGGNADALPGAQFLTTAGVGELAVLEVNLP